MKIDKPGGKEFLADFPETSYGRIYLDADEWALIETPFFYVHFRFKSDGTPFMEIYGTRDFNSAIEPNAYHNQASVVVIAQSVKGAKQVSPEPSRHSETNSLEGEVND
jgi:hypothetical protein